MAKELDLGRVVGNDATINGKNAIQIVAGDNIDIQQTDETITISVSGEIDNEHFTDQSNPHKVTAAQVGAVPTSRTVNGKTLDNNITITGEDVGVVPGTTAPKMDGTAAVGTDAKFARADHVHPHDTAKQDKLTGKTDQYVGFDESGNAVPKVLNYQLFGFELDMDEADPASKIRYLEGNSNYQSAKMNFTSGAFEPGDWGDAWFMKDIHPVVLNADGTVKYELNKNNYKQKIDGSAIDVTDAGSENVMIGIPTVWIKVDTSVARKPKFYFSSVKLDASYHAYAHINSAGKVMDYTYMAAYNGWLDDNKKMRSISGKVPTRSQTGTDQITESRANNPTGVTIWDMETLSDHMLITLLLLLIGKSTNTQAVFGNGNMNGYNNSKNATGYDEYGVLNTGSMDTNGLFWGSNADNKGVKVFGIENFWGNVWRRTQGMILDNGVLKIKMTRGTDDGSSATDYNTTATGYINAGVTLAAANGTANSDYFNGYIDDVAANQYGLFMSNLKGSATTQYCDMGWFRTTDKRFALFGGRSRDGSSCGAFACSLRDLVSYSNWCYGVAVSCKPAA